MKSPGLVKELLKAIGVTLVFFLIAEALLRVTYFARNSAVAYVPLPYALGDDYGPVPPWLDRLRILTPDETLIWRGRSNLHRRYMDMFSPAWTEEERVSLLRRFLPVVPASFKGDPVWEMSLNSEGFRDGEFPRAKPPSVFRILCLGDSWTFGANVEQERAYPQQLRALLAREFPGANFEVLNLGVLGYSSYQGLELLRRRGVTMTSDLVVIGFAMNDAKMAGYRDKDIPAGHAGPGIAERIANMLDQFESYKLLRYLALVLKDKPKSVRERVQAEADSAGEEKRDVYAEFEPWTRVNPSDYELNVVRLIDLARSRGAGVILLYNGLRPEGPYRTILEAISKEKGVPLVDSSALIAAARRQFEAELEEKLGLRPLTDQPAPRNGEIEVTFRAYLGQRPVPRAVYIVGAHPTLGDLTPNTIPMYDDGTHGDQRAGDHVWSYSARFPGGTRLLYMYTNSGGAGRWEGLDVPAIRRFMVEAREGQGRVYTPIDSFGRIYMQADGWHTNAAGYDLIARAVLEQVTRDARVKGYLEKRAKSS